LDFDAALRGWGLKINDTLDLSRPRELRDGQ
jgi:hypothetical protein